LYHYVTVSPLCVITMCIMFQQRLPRCPRLSTEQSKSASTCSFRLAISVNVIYEVGVSTSGEPALVVFTVGIVVAIMLFLLVHLDQRSM
jgi:hypothetical protein